MLLALVFVFMTLRGGAFVWFESDEFGPRLIAVIAIWQRATYVLSSILTIRGELDCRN
jgi:hypothetical protein